MSFPICSTAWRASALCALAVAVASCSDATPIDAAETAAVLAQRTCETAHACRATFSGSPAEFTASYGNDVTSCMTHFAGAELVAHATSGAQQGRFDGAIASACLEADGPLACDQAWAGAEVALPSACTGVFAAPPLPTGLTTRERANENRNNCTGCTNGTQCRTCHTADPANDVGDTTPLAKGPRRGDRAEGGATWSLASRAGLDDATESACTAPAEVRASQSASGRKSCAGNCHLHN